MSKRIKLDPQNFNRHTDEGMELLEHSIKEVGAIESVTIDKNGEIISGNARFKTFEKLGYKPKVIELSENEYPVIATNLEGEKRVKAAILANTTAKRNINLDTDLIQEIAVEQYEIDIDEVGVEIIKTVDFSSFNKELNQSNFENEKCFFKLMYSQKDYYLLIEKLSKTGKTAEQIFYEALI